MPAEDIEPSLNWVDGVPAVDTDELGINFVAADEIIMGRRSSSGAEFCLGDNSTGPGTTFGPDADAAASGTCTGGW
jgi:hypothetical protein